MQSPKVCGIFYVAPYCAISVSIVFFILNMVLFDINPKFSEYQYISAIKKKYSSVKPSLDPLGNTMGVDQIQGTISELSDKTMISSLQFMTLKIYVYNLPSRFNTDLLKSRSGYSSNDETGCKTEATIHNFLLTSNHRVRGAAKADFFYVPVYGWCYYHHQPSIHTDNNPLKLYQEALAYIKSHHPYFNMSYGRDHVWSISSSPLKKASHHLWQVETKNSIILYYGIQSIKAIEYVPHKDFVIPPDLSRYNFTPYHELALKARSKRRYVVHTSSSSYSFNPPTTNSSKKTYYFRQLLLSMKVKISSFKSKSVIHDMMSSTFCLCIPASHSCSELFYLSILSGCIPVLFGTDTEIAFQGVVDPSRFTVQVRFQDIDHLKEILLSISYQHVASMQNEMERVWKLFYYGSNGVAQEAIIKSLVNRKSNNRVHYHYYSTAKLS